MVQLAGPGSLAQVSASLSKGEMRHPCQKRATGSLRAWQSGFQKDRANRQRHAVPGTI